MLLGSAGHPFGEARRVYPYLNPVITDCAPLRLSAIAQDIIDPGQRSLGLKSVYVDLHTDYPIHVSCRDYEQCRRSTSKPESLRHDPASSVHLPSMLEVLAAHKTLVLLGLPGSGKSTLTCYLALSLSEAGQGDDAPLDRLGKTWIHGSLVPVRIVLRKFADSLPLDLEEGRAGDLWRFIENEKGGFATATGPFLRELAAKAGALFLLDGLDEAGDEKRSLRVLEAAAEFIHSAGAQCRFQMTARPMAP